MLFRRCTINGVDYNHPPSELEEEYSKPGAPAPPIIVNAKLSEDMCNTNGQYFTESACRIQEFLTVLAICNTVVVSATPHRDMMNASGVIEPNSVDSSASPSVRMKQNELSGAAGSSHSSG